MRSTSRKYTCNIANVLAPLIVLSSVSAASAGPILGGQYTIGDQGTVFIEPATPIQPGDLFAAVSGTDVDDTFYGPFAIDYAAEVDSGVLRLRATLTGDGQQGGLLPSASLNALTTGWFDYFTIDGLSVGTELHFNFRATGAITTVGTSSLGGASGNFQFQASHNSASVFEPVYMGGNVDDDITFSTTYATGQNYLSYYASIQSFVQIGQVDVDFFSTLKLSSVTLADGSTPESQGFEIAFASGIDSPNLNPVPEPTSLALFGTGVGGLIAMRRRRRSARQGTSSGESQT